MSAGTWHRLSIRVVYLDLIRVAMSLASGYLGIVLRDEPVWPLLAGAFAGLLGALADLQRWRTTRYRITARQVEMRSGWPGRRHRIVARDRIRTVNRTARLLPRLLGLCTVHIGSGESESSFKLEGLDRRHAARLQRELMPPDPLLPEPPPPIARMRRAWIPLNVVTVWSVFAVIGPLFGLHWILRAFGIDLFGVLTGHLVVVLLIAYPLGVAVTTVTFLLENANFELVRTGTPPDTALVTRRGLLTTQTVQHSDERLRGIAFEEPLAWRWLRLARTKVIATGLRFGDSTGSGVLPRIRLAEARDLAARILPDGSRPLEAPLQRHPRGALLRRLGWAVYVPALVSGAMLLLGAGGAIPGWVWPLPLALVPLSVPAAVVAYRALGHGLSGRYLVVRGGVLNRRTVALQRRAVIGWTFQQSLLQRRGGRMSVGVATAAGNRYYRVPDASVAQALAFASDATPELADRFLALSPPASGAFSPPASGAFSPPASGALSPPASGAFSPPASGA